MRKNCRSAAWTSEARFAGILRKYGLRGWSRQGRLPGRPDFVFPRRRVAVFIDGDFWHGNPANFRLPRRNSEYWLQRVASVRRRDCEVTLALRRLGWRVARIWESSLVDEEAIAGRLKLML